MPPLRAMIGRRHATVGSKTKARAPATAYLVIHTIHSRQEKTDLHRK